MGIYEVDGVLASNQIKAILIEEIEAKNFKDEDLKELKEKMMNGKTQDFKNLWLLFPTSVQKYAFFEVIQQAFGVHTSLVDNFETSSQNLLCICSSPTNNKFALDLYTSWSHPNE